jgi:urease accessory protein
MRAYDAPIPVRTVQQPSSAIDPGRVRVVELPMTAHDRRRVRRLVEAPDGTTFALELPTGTVLHPGQVLYADEDRAYIVTAAPEEVLVVRPRDVSEAARVAHLIGSLHRDIDVNGGEIIALADDTLADRLARLGAAVARVRRAFHGRAPGEHAH